MDNIILTTFLFIFTLICVKDIRYGIYAVIFSMPLYFIRFSIFGIPTTALEIMIYILFIFWIFGKIKKNNFYPALAEGFSGFSRLNKNNALLIGITLLFLGVIISTFNSTDIKTSLGIFKGWFVDPFLFFVVFVSVIKEKKHIILSLKSCVFSGIAVSLISIFYLLSNNLTFDGRLKSFFLSPNHLAMYLAPAFLIGLFFLLNKKVSSIKYQVSSVVLIIILIPLYLTYSYGAFLGIFAGVIWLFYKTQTCRHSKSKLLLIILLFFVSIGFIFLSSNKFSQIINSDNRSSFHSRIMIWSASVEIIKDSPVFGIGPGTFQKTYLSYSDRFDKPYLEWAVPQPHNVFLAFYLQTGIIGFFGFILILYWLFTRKNRYIIIDILIIYIIIHGLTDTTYWKNDLSLIFWIIIGLAVVMENIEKISDIKK